MHWWHFIPFVVVSALLSSIVAGFIWLEREMPATDGPVPSKQANAAAPVSHALPLDTPPAPESYDADRGMAPALDLQQGELAWEADLKRITQFAERNKSELARSIFAALPSLPEEALAAATEQAVDGLGDRDFTKYAQPLLASPSTHGQVQGVLFADLMRRADRTVLPILMEIANNDEHPYRGSAQDNLGLMLGADSTRWEAGVATARGAR